MPKFSLSADCGSRKSASYQNSTLWSSDWAGLSNGFAHRKRDRIAKLGGRLGYAASAPMASSTPNRLERLWRVAPARGSTEKQRHGADPKVRIALKALRPGSGNDDTYQGWRVGRATVAIVEQIMDRGG